MLASQLIHDLQKKIDMYGDLPVYVPDYEADYEESESAGVRHYEETEHLSECCGGGVYEDTDICTECKEHTGVEFLPERFFIKI